MKPPAILGIQCLLGYIAVRSTFSAWGLAMAEGQEMAIVVTVVLVLAATWVAIDLQGPTRSTRAFSAVVLTVLSLFSVFRLVGFVRAESAGGVVLGAGLMTLSLVSCALALLLNEAVVGYLSVSATDDSDGNS